MHYLYLLLILFVIGLIIELVTVRQAVASLGGATYTLIPWRVWIPHAVLFLAVIMLLYAVRGVLAPFIIGLVIAYLFNPFLEFLGRHGWHRAWAMAAVGVVLVALFVVFAWKGVPLLVTQFQRLAEDVPNYLDTASEWLQPRLAHSPPYVEDWVNSLPGYLSEQGPVLTKAFLNWAGRAFSTVMVLVLGLIVAMWLLADYGGTRKRMLAFIPEQQRATLLEVGHGVNDVLGGYLRGMAVMCGLVGLCGLIILWLFHVPYFLLLALLVGLGYAIPYFGVPTSTGIAVVFSAMDGHHWQSIVGMVVCLLAVNLIADYLVTPRVVGKRVGLHGLVVMFALLAGASLFGVVGMIIAVPVAASFKVVLAYAFPRIFGTLHHDQAA